MKDEIIEMTGEKLEAHVKAKVDTAVAAAAAQAKTDAEKAAKKHENPFYATPKSGETPEFNEKTSDAFYAVALESYKTGDAMNIAAQKMSSNAENSAAEQHYKRVQYVEEHRTGAEKATVTMRSNEIIIPEVISSLVPEKLEPNQIVRSIQGMNMVNLDKANYKVNRENTVPTASWIDYEGATTDGTDYTFTPIELTPKKVQSKFIISKEALTASSVLTNQRIGNKLDKALAKAEDLAFLYGTGIGPIPLGIDEIVLAANVITSTATAYATFNTEIYKTLRNIRKAGGGDVSTDNVILITSSDVTDGMLAFMTVEGLQPFASVGNGKFGRYTIMESNHVKMNTGTGSESEMFFLNKNDFVIGRAAAKSLKVLTSGAVTDNGSVLTLDDTNQVAFVMTETVDFGMIRNNTSAKLKEIGLFA